MAALASTEKADLGQEVDQNASPAGSIDTTTPDTEFSPPESPIQRSGPPKNARALAKNKLAALTVEEKVCSTEGPF
jgi:beta-glucosidase